MTQPIPFFVWGLIAAFATALLLSAIAAALGRGGESPTSPRWGATLGLGLGYAIGHVLIQMMNAKLTVSEAHSWLRTWVHEGGPFPFFAHERVDWLPWLAIAATILGLLDGWKPAPWWAKWENRLAITALTLVLMLSRLFGETWSPSEGALWFLGLGAAMLASWSVLDARAIRLGSGMTWVLLLMSVAASATLFLSYMAIPAVLCGAMSAALGGVALVSLANRRMTLARGAVPVFVTLYNGFLLVGLFSGDLASGEHAVALAASPSSDAGMSTAFARSPASRRGRSERSAPPRSSSPLASRSGWLSRCVNPKPIRAATEPLNAGVKWGWIVRKPWVGDRDSVIRYFSDSRPRFRFVISHPWLPGSLTMAKFGSDNYLNFF